LLFKSAYNTPLKEGPRNLDELELNGTHQRLVFTLDDNSLDENINTMRTNKGTIINVSKENGLKRRAKKMRYMIMCRHKNAG
jgi:hypothetical protein